MYPSRVSFTVLVAGGVLLAGLSAAPAVPSGSASSASAASAAGDDAQARIVSLQPLADGRVRVVSDVTMPAADAPPSPGGDTVVTVTTAEGEVWRRAAVEPARIRAELPVRPGDTRLTGLSVPDPSPVVRVRVPVDLDIRSVALRIGGERHASSYRPAAAQRRAPAPTRVALPGWTQGPSSNRLDVVVLGDGYTAAQQADFVADATEVADDVFGVTPFAEYRDFVNVVGVFVPSAQSGADQPGYSSSCSDYSSAPTCCPDSSAANAAKLVDTRYDSTFCFQGIQRLLVPGDVAAVHADANAALPAWEQILMVVNDEEYGGSGGAIATTSTHPSGTAVMTHELGHSLLGLDDEYDTFTPGYPPCSDEVGANDPPCRANVTDVTTRASLKWRRWVDPSTEIPTPGQPGAEVVGLFEGAHYSPVRWYRSCFDCLMRSLQRPMGPVGSEQLPLRLFGAPFHVGLIEPDSMSHPTDETVVVAPGETVTLSLDVLSARPAPGTTVQWYVGRQLVRAETVGTGTVSLEVTGTDTAQEVGVSVESLPGVLHPSRARPVTHQDRVWTLAPTDGATLPGHATGAPTGAGRAYVKLGPAVSCGSGDLEARVVSPRGAARVRSIVFLADGVQVARVRGRELPDRFLLSLGPATQLVSAEVRRRGAGTLQVERSYEPCS